MTVTGGLDEESSGGGSEKEARLIKVPEKELREESVGKGMVDSSRSATRGRSMLFMSEGWGVGLGAREAGKAEWRLSRSPE